MKKSLLFFLTFSLGLSAFSFAAYSPTETDTKQLNDIKNVLTTVNDTDLWNYYTQFSKLQKAVSSTSSNGVDEDGRVEYLLTNLRDWSYTQFSMRKNLVQQQSKEEKADFLERYKYWILLDEEVSGNCLWRYNTLDNLSFANNFPTALTIAVWYRESTCGYTLPRNGYGPFQIISKDYGSGTISEEVFVQTVQDFFDFSRNKIDRYNERNAGSELNIWLSYREASQTDLLRFAALYNGLSGGTVYGEIAPAAPKYFYEGYANEVWTGESRKDWIFPMYLKVLEWELNN